MDTTHFIERMKSDCAKIDGNVELWHRVHVNVAECINICIRNDGTHTEDDI